MKLLTDEYQRQIWKMENWGTNGWKWAGAVLKLISKYKLNTALDYGCGQGTLRKEVMKGFSPSGWYKEYDPAKDLKLPVDQVHLVTCTDVLEHVEPEYLNNVIAHILSLSSRVCFLVISLKECERKLPDGRGAHLIIQKAGWWMELISWLMLDTEFNSMERIFSSRLDNSKQLILVLRKIDKEEALDKE